MQTAYLVITRNGATLFSAGYGLADIEQGMDITPRTAFYAASVSKQFTAASIGLLVLRGQLSLDASVRNFVPEVPDYGTPITVRHASDACGATRPRQCSS